MQEWRKNIRQLTAASMTASCMHDSDLVHTFAQVNLVATLDRVLGEVPVCKTFEVHQGNLASSNLHIREGINDIRYQTCMCNRSGK